MFDMLVLEFLMLSCVIDQTTCRTSQLNSRQTRSQKTRGELQVLDEVFQRASPGTNHYLCIPSLQDTYPMVHMFSLLSFCSLCQVVPQALGLPGVSLTSRLIELEGVERPSHSIRQGAPLAIRLLAIAFSIILFICWNPQECSMCDHKSSYYIVDQLDS